MLLERTQAFAQLLAQLRARLAQRGDDLLLGIRLHLLACDGLLTPRIDGFQGDQVFAADRGDLRHHYGFQSLAFADFDTHVPGQGLAGITAHGPQGFADAAFGQHAEERRLGEFDLERFVQRIVEDGVAGFVHKAGQQDDVGSGQHWLREKDAPGSKRSDNQQNGGAGR